MAQNTIPYDVVDACSIKHTFKNASLIWPKLLEADTKFNPVFTTGVRFESEEDPALVSFLNLCDQALQSFIEAVEKGQYVKKPKGGWKVHDVRTREVDEDDDNNEAVFVNVKCKAVDHKGNDRSLVVVDAARNPIPRTTSIGGGSVANVVCSLRPFYMPTLGFGVSLRLEAVQILKVRSGSSAVNPESEFDIVEGGFTAAPVAEDDEVPAGDGDF